MQLPGTFWVAVVTAVIGILEGDWFAGAGWVPAVVIGLAALVRIFEVYGLPALARLIDPLAETQPARAVGQSPHGRAFRVLFGG